MYHDVTVATITLARSEQEADHLLAALTHLADYGRPVYVADGGSIKSFLERLKELPGVTVREHVPHGGPRLLTQVKTALETACAGCPRYVLYTEPDKAWFFQHRLWLFMPYAFRTDEPGIIAAARDCATFSTFPAGQQLTESLMNRLAGELFGQKGDYSYGPLLIRADLLPHLDRLQEDIGWGWRFFLMAIAHRLDRRIQMGELDLPCPPEQRSENEMPHRLYRMEQLGQNVRGLTLGLRAPDIPVVTDKSRPAEET